MGLLASICLAAARAADGAPPKVETLFPAGGQRGQTVTISASGKFDPWPVNVWVDDPQIRIVAGDKAGDIRIDIGPDAAPGAKLVRLFNAQGSAALAPFVVGTLAERVEQEPNNEPTKAERVEMPVTINGRLGAPGDVDVFAVSLRAGQTLVAAVEAHWPLRSPMDAVLQLLSSDGVVLQQENDSPRLDPRLVFTAPSDGTYLVRLFAYPSTPTASIQLAGGDRFVYRLTLTACGLIDHAFPLAGQSPAAGATASPPPAALELCGWNIPAGLRPIEAPSPGDSNSLTVYHPQLAGQAHVMVVADPVIVEAEPNTASHPQQVGLPVVVCGRIAEPGDTDGYSFHAAKGDRIAVSVASQQLGFPLDPVLKVIDGAEKVLTTQDDRSESRDAELVFVAPCDGEYRVVIADLYGHGGPRHVYRLRMAPVRPDFALTLAAGEFAMAGGGKVEIPVTIDRRGDFSREIEVDCVGLPNGVASQAVVFAAKGKDAKTVKLSLTAGEEPFSGPIQVVGRPKGDAGKGEASIGDASKSDGPNHDPAEQRIARFVLVGSGLSTDKIWLTVTSK